MKGKELFEAISGSTGVKPGAVRKVILGLSEHLKTELAKGEEKVTLPAFGTFVYTGKTGKGGEPRILFRPMKPKTGEGAEPHEEAAE